MQSDHGEKRPSKVILAVLAAVFVAALAGLFWSYSLSGRLTHAEAQLAATQQKNRQLATALDQTNAKLRVTSQSLGHRLSVTQRELRRRAEAMRHRQQAATALPQLAQGQSQAQPPGVNTQAAPAVNNGLAAGAGSTGVAKSNAVEATSQAAPPSGSGALKPGQMQKAQGDLGILSGLIATNPSELKVLEQMGARNYYPFTLRKGRKVTVAAIALRLRRVNEKRHTYSMTVYAGAKKIEKKNRALDEPVQFYAGKQHLLFELVVNQIGHDEVQGYLSTPTSAPKSVAAQKKAVSSQK